MSTGVASLICKFYNAVMTWNNIHYNNYCNKFNALCLKSENYFPFYHGISCKDLIKDCTLIPFWKKIMLLLNSLAKEQRKNTLTNQFKYLNANTVDCPFKKTHHIKKVKTEIDYFTFTMSIEEFRA